MSYLKSAPTNLSDCNILQKNKNALIWDQNALFGYFWSRILKNYCHIWNQHPQSCLISQFREKTKMPKFGTKNVLFGYFWSRISKNYCHIWNQHPQICLIVKFREKTEMPKFGTKNALFGYFWGRILKNYCRIWNQRPQIFHKWVFNSHSAFWYRVCFRGLLFLKVRVRVRARFIKYANWSLPLYKAC